MQAIQDTMQGNHCYGCGPDNQLGLRLKSYRQPGGLTTASFLPQSHHNAGPKHFLNGGIIATLIDCHTICAAWADAYIREGRELGAGENVWYVTGQLDVSYLRPVRIDHEVSLVAVIKQVADKKTIVDCELISAGKVCATAKVTAIRVPSDWTE